MIGTLVGQYRARCRARQHCVIPTHSTNVADFGIDIWGQRYRRWAGDDVWEPVTLGRWV